MASVATRSVMGTGRVAPCPVEPSDAVPKETTEQTSWWPSSLLSSSTPQAPADVEPVPQEGDAVPTSSAADSSSGVSADQPLRLENEARDPASPPCEDSDQDSCSLGTATEPAPACDAPVLEELDAASEDSPAVLHASKQADEAAERPPGDASPAAGGAASMLSAAALVDGGMQSMEADSCSICLENFSDSDPAVLTMCNHEYHFQCVLEWAQRKEECPMCWQALKLSDPCSQELLDMCARERKEVAAAAEAHAELLNSGSRIVFVRNVNAMAHHRVARQRPMSPWRAQAGPSPAPLEGSPPAHPRSGVSSLFGIGGRNRGTRGGGGGSSEFPISSSASADPGLGTFSPPPSNQSWFKRSAAGGSSSSRDSTRSSRSLATGSQLDGPVAGSARGGLSSALAESSAAGARTAVLASTTSAPGAGPAGGDAGANATLAAMGPSRTLTASSFSSSSSSLASHLSAGTAAEDTEVRGSSAPQDISLGARGPLPAPQRQASAAARGTSSGGSSWRAKFSFRGNRSAERAVHGAK